MFKRLIALIAVLVLFFAFSGVTSAFQPHPYFKAQKGLRVLDSHEGKVASEEMDEGTEKAVKKFQTKCNLKPTAKIRRIECKRTWKEVPKEISPSEELF